MERRSGGGPLAAGLEWTGDSRYYSSGSGLVGKTDWDPCPDDPFYGHHGDLYRRFNQGLPACWWSLAWHGCGFAPWYASWDWSWHWTSYWRRNYVILSTFYYPSCYVPYSLAAWMPFGHALGATWIYGVAFPYVYVWINHADYADGWYSPYASRVRVVYEDGSEFPGPEDEVVRAGPGPRVESQRQPESALEVARRYVQLGDAYFASERYADAADSYLRALAYAPESPTVYFALADALFAAGDYNYAAYAIRKGIVLDPALAESPVDKRTFYVEPARFLEQMNRLTEHLARQPRDGDAWLVLAYNRLFSGDPDGAREGFEKVADLVPGDRASALFLERLPAGPRP